jgi:hypothetical protein
MLRVIIQIHRVSSIQNGMDPNDSYKTNAQITNELHMTLVLDEIQNYTRD